MFLPGQFTHDWAGNMCLTPLAPQVNAKVIAQMQICDLRIKTKKRSGQVPYGEVFTRAAEFGSAHKLLRIRDEAVKKSNAASSRVFWLLRWRLSIGRNEPRGSFYDALFHVNPIPWNILLCSTWLCTTFQPTIRASAAYNSKTSNSPCRP